jgi:glucose/arabinose dehydrogenase
MRTEIKHIWSRSILKRYILIAAAVFFLIALAVWPLIRSAQADQPPSFDWRAEWAVPEGFALEIDTEGYHFPTAIAFVPEPGSDPKDPLYFVTELRGQVKVITNDRSIYTFAKDFFQLKPEQELPEVEGETGLAGICLAPEQGYMFVTFAYQDSEGVLRNNIVRFESNPHSFSLEPTGQMAFTDLFANYESAISHQIGSCQVADEFLYVSVGDGRQTKESQNVNSLLGKVLRLTLDGQPVPNNPFYDAGDTQKAADFVWSYGLRNPFGLKAVGDRLFVADNGSDIDRLLEAQAGENYLWDGTDWSIGARADLALSPDVGPAQLEFNALGSTAFPEVYEQSFFLAASKPEVTGVLRLPYNLEEDGISGVPQYLLRYQGSDMQIVVGVALGPDGLYVVPMLPNVEGRSFILKVAYEPDRQHPFLISDGREPRTLMWEKGCFGCHQLGDEGGTAGPALNQPQMTERLNAKLNSPEYLQTLQEVDRLDREPFVNFKEARSEVMELQGQEKLRTWMIYHIMEPKFDNPNSLMPNTGLTRAEATVITDYLLQERQKTTLERGKDIIIRYLPTVILPRHLFFALTIGVVIGAVFSAALIILVRRKHGKRTVSEE